MFRIDYTGRLIIPLHKGRKWHDNTDKDILQYEGVNFFEGNALFQLIPAPPANTGDLD